MRKLSIITQVDKMDVNSERYVKSIKRIAQESEDLVVQVHEIFNKRQFNDVCSSIKKIDGGSILVIEPCEFNINDTVAKDMNVENYQTARVVGEEIVKRFNPKRDKVLIIGKGKVVGKPLFEILTKSNFATCIVGRTPELQQEFIDMFDIVVYACSPNVKPHSHKKETIIFDVAGLFRKKENEPMMCITMREIGTETTKLMLKEVKKSKWIEKERMNK